MATKSGIFHLEDLKGKFGVNPTRSRHCEWEQAVSMPLYQAKRIWEGTASDDHEPGDLPDFDCTSSPTRIGRCFESFLNMTIFRFL
jgi:hypothetical protein